MNYLKSIFEGITKLPISSFLNWNEIEFEKSKQKRAEKYKKYGGIEVAKERKSPKQEIKQDIDKLKLLEDPGIIFTQRQAETMQFFTLYFYSIQYKENILDIFKKWNIDPLAAKTHFAVEDRLNRIHFVKGVTPQLRGTGFSELLYKEFLHYIGWGTSNADAKPAIKLIWSKLAKDDDFYTIVTYFDVLAISKKHEYTKDEIKQIVYRFLEAKVEDVYKYRNKTEIDPKLLKMFPELKEKFYRKPAVIKRYERILRAPLDYLPFINDSLIIRNNNAEEYGLIRDVYFCDGRIYYWCVVRAGHLIITPYIEDGEIGFNKVEWKEIDRVDHYTILHQNVNVIGLIPNIKEGTNRVRTAQDLVDGNVLTFIPRRIIYNGEVLEKLVFTRTRVKNTLEVRIMYKGEKRLQLIKNYSYYKKILIR